MPDPPRRRMREAVVQLLYAVDPASELQDQPDQAVLSLLLEPLREKATRARAKAVLHLQQGRDKACEQFPQLLRTLGRMELDDEDGELGAALRDWNQAEQDLLGALEAMRRELNGNRNAERLRTSLEIARLRNRASRAAAARVAASNPHFPALQQLRQDALGLRDLLARPTERLQQATEETDGDLPELNAVTRAEEEVAQTASRLESYHRGLREHLPEIDERLASTVDHYSPERINRVDRAILRLGAYELLFDPGVPSAVAIDEAIELARSFGTTESAGFVNGILDGLAKTRAAQ